MWYPTLPDLMDLHERVAGASGHAPAIADSKALARAVVAPQRAGREAPGPRRLARKAAALYLTVVQSSPFRQSNARTAFAGMLSFLHRNGVRLGLSFEDVQRRIEEAGGTGLDAGTLAAMLAPNLSRRDTTRSSRRLLAALSHLARSVEALETEPALDGPTEALDQIGTDLSRALTAGFEVEADDRTTIREAYPAVDSRWGDALSPSQE